jgi:phosphohistidine phosphatase
MDLILWRHADALDGEPDMARALTEKGRKQAEKMAAWLRQRLPANTLVLVSPAVRALQTADALGEDYKVLAELAPGADGVHVLGAAGWPDAAAAALVVGHQPTLGEAAHILLCGAAGDLSIKKGGVLWLSNRVRGGTPRTFIRAAMTAELV